jgi:hypothetical protein
LPATALTCAGELGWQSPSSTRNNRPHSPGAAAPSAAAAVAVAAAAAAAAGCGFKIEEICGGSWDLRLASGENK